MKYMTSSRVPRDRVLAIYAGVQVPSTEALVDTVAEDAVIAEQAMDRFEHELQRWPTGRCSRLLLFYQYLSWTRSSLPSIWLAVNFELQMDIAPPMHRLPSGHRAVSIVEFGDR